MSTPHPDPEDLALAALPAEPRDPALVEHLAECVECRGHVAELARTVALAKDGTPDVDGQGVPERVWTAIALELGPELDAATALPRAEPLAGADDPAAGTGNGRGAGTARRPGRDGAAAEGSDGDGSRDDDGPNGHGAESRGQSDDRAADGSGDRSGDPADGRITTADVAAAPGGRAAQPRRRTPSARPARRQRWRAALVPVAAAVVALAVGVAIGVGASDGGKGDGGKGGGGNGGGGAPGVAGGEPPTVVAQLRPVGAVDPAGSGTVTAVEQAGVRTMVVHLSGVTDTVGADYLEAWLMNATGTQIVALGALAPAVGGYEGSFTVPANLPMAELDVVDVSAERYDGDPGHSGLSILRGTVS